MEMELAEYWWIRTSTHEADTGFVPQFHTAVQ